MVRPPGRVRAGGVEVAGMPATRKPASTGARKRRAAPRSKPRSTRRARRPSPVRALRETLARAFTRVPLLDQRQRELLGLACLALGSYLAFVLYGGWDGGRVGHGLTVAL